MVNIPLVLTMIRNTKRFLKMDIKEFLHFIIRHIFPVYNESRKYDKMKEVLYALVINNKFNQMERHCQYFSDYVSKR